MPKTDCFINTASDVTTASLIDTPFCPLKCIPFNQLGWKAFQKIGIGP